MMRISLLFLLSLQLSARTITLRMVSDLSSKMPTEQSFKPRMPATFITGTWWRIGRGA